MKRIKFLYAILPLFFAALFCMTACDNDIKDIPKIKENLELEPSATDIVLDEDNPHKPIITFTWCAARKMSDEYILSYESKLDVAGHSFGSKTVILNYEDDDVFSRSFTSKEIQDWANDKWNMPVNKNFTLEFRVVAEWEGGPTFEPPEVRTVTVNVRPYQVEIFDADKVSLDGSALVSGREEEISKTTEDPNIFATIVNLKAGKLRIPVELNKETYYICPTDGEGTVKDGETEDVKMDANPIAWDIETPGQYRIVINMERKTINIYSPATDLKPLFVEWDDGAAEGGRRSAYVTDLWLYGGGTGWGWRKGNFTASLADPQVLIYHGEPLGGGGVKFVVYIEGDYNKNVAYAFTNPLTPEGNRQNLPLAMDKLGELHGGYDGETRNSYYGLASSSKKIILDLRNMTIITHKE